MGFWGFGGPNGITHPGGITLVDPMHDVIASEESELTIASGQSVTLSGGQISGRSLVNNGLLTYNSGTLFIDGALTIGPTGQLNNSPSITVNEGSSIYATHNDLTIQSSQVVTLNGGLLEANRLINNGTLYYNSGSYLLTLET